MSSIHCPSCGKEATTDQQFCRQCGMSLGTVSKLVAAHSGIDTVEDQVRLSREEAEKRIVRKMFSWMTWGMIVAAIGIVMLILTKSFNPGEWFKLCASFLLLSGTGIAVAGFFKAIKEGTELPKRSQKAVTRVETTKYLPEERAEVPMTSITERTTQLITPKEKQNNNES